MEGLNDLQHLFALNPIPLDCIDAANRATENFDEGFPGWQLYSRIARGDRLFDRGLAAWAITIARSVARAKQHTGHPFVARRVRRNDWIMQAGLDALARTIAGKFPEAAFVRAQQFSVDKELFAKLRNGLAHAMIRGFERYCGELFLQYVAVRKLNRKNFAAIRRNSQNTGDTWVEEGNNSFCKLAHGCYRKPLVPDADTRITEFHGVAVGMAGNWL